MTLKDFAFSCDRLAYNRLTLLLRTTRNTDKILTKKHWRITKTMHISKDNHVDRRAKALHSFLLLHLFSFIIENCRKSSSIAPLCLRTELWECVATVTFTRSFYFFFIENYNSIVIFNCIIFGVTLDFRD